MSDKKQNYKVSFNGIKNIVYQKILENKEKLSLQWDNPKGTRTKYFVLDNLLPHEMTMKIYNNFPDQESSLWNNADTFREKKQSFAKIDDLDEIIRIITDVFHDKQIISCVGEICKMKSLEADPSLYAGGISLMKNGDFLNPHIDNSHDKSRLRYRRLNLLFYVTPDWDSSKGGNFELWDDKVLTPKEITSKFSRLVVMETNKYSWHSVNKVVSDYPRCCVSNYYFSLQSPTQENYYHVTSFNGRPNQKFLRLYCQIDNKLRYFVAKWFKISRGKNLVRNT